MQVFNIDHKLMLALAIIFAGNLSLWERKKEIILRIEVKNKFL
jgi:hypothetical protein